MRALLKSALLLLWGSGFAAGIFWLAGFHTIAFGFQVVAFLVVIGLPLMLTIANSEWKQVGIAYLAILIVSTAEHFTQNRILTVAAPFLVLIPWVFVHLKIAGVLLRNARKIRCFSTATMVSLLWPIALVPYLAFADIKE